MRDKWERGCAAYLGLLTAVMAMAVMPRATAQMAKNHRAVKDDRRVIRVYVPYTLCSLPETSQRSGGHFVYRIQ